MPPGYLHLEIFQARPTGRRPKTLSRDHISPSGIPQEELESVAGERDIEVSLPDLLHPPPNLG